MIHPPYWLNPHLAILIRPYGDASLDDDMLTFRRAGIDVIVSMLQRGEAVSLGLEEEEASANRTGLLFENFPIPDGGVPSDVLRFTDFLDRLEDHMAEGRKLGIHCRASIGRAPLTAASLLIRSGMSPRDAWLRIATVRDYPVPDARGQRLWVDAHIKPKS